MRNLLYLLLLVATSAFAQSGVNVTNKGASAKNSRGAGVEVKKNDVSAKNSKGQGVQANKKGLEVKGSKGGMNVDKKGVRIQSKHFNVKLGK